jgi:curved DNA-binding protein
MSVQYKDYYRLLGVPRNASQTAIQQAFRKLARRYHPDMNRTSVAEERFKGINEAYEVLKDANKRMQYDALGSSWREGQEFNPPPGWNPNGFQAPKQSPTNGTQTRRKPSTGFSDFFETLFGKSIAAFKKRNERKKREETYGWAMRGDDIQTSIHVTLQDVFSNATKSIELEIQDSNLNGRTVLCRKRFEVKIPEGTKQGSKIRLAGQGCKGTYGGENGDLYILVHILQHPTITVNEFDLETVVEIEPWEAALGREITVPTVDGHTTVQLPPRTNSGKRICLPQKGLMKRNKLRGDLYVTIQIAFPRFHSMEERKMYEQLGKMAKKRNRGM